MSANDSDDGGSNGAQGSGSSHATFDLSGGQLGGFRLLRRLGQGAMADVYLAEQPSLHRRVAVKVLKPELAQDQVYLKRFRREAQAAAALVHANIVQIYEVGEIDGLHYIAQEYVEGQNLRQWLARNGSPDLVHALSIMRQAAGALAKAGEHGIVHRDIKPENILLTHGGEVKVADFGLARFAREGDAVDLTQAGTTLGTPLYMSPEQVEGKPLDPRSDIYSLGVTCYHMLSGAPPFAGDTALAVAVQHLNKPPKPLESARPDLPPEFCQIVHKMLAKQPDDRYGSAYEVLRELRQLQRDSLGDQWPDDLPAWDGGAPPTKVRSRNEVTARLDSLMKGLARRPAARRRLLLVPALAVAALLGAGLAYFFCVPRPLLAAKGASAAIAVPERSALRQYYLASQLGTEEGWQRVIKFFPNDEYFVHRAQQQLARIYLQENNDASAMAIFEKLAALGPGDEEFQAFGLAGKCGLLSLEGHYQDSANVMEQLTPLQAKLKDEQISQLLAHAIKRNHQKLNVQSNQQWQKWLDDEFRQTD